MPTCTIGSQLKFFFLIIFRDFGRVQGVQSGAYGTVFHQQNKATECAICRRAHLIGTDLKVVSRTKRGITSQ